MHPEFRRRGIGRGLMQRAEQAARGIGRTLLTLDTRAGDDGEALYRSLGWQEAGRVPNFASDAAGKLHDTVFFYRALQS
ncbi:GNAT family N-acetyltransferase [Pseudoroseomonas wenyumeiae]